MALRQSQFLKLQQKLSPQQIQLMKLIQLPIMALEQRIKEELEINPALEEDDNLDAEEDFTNEDSSVNEVDNETDAENYDNEDAKVEEVGLQNDDISFEDYVDEDEFSDYKYQISNSGKDDDLKETPLRELTDFHALLEEQLGLLDVHENKYTIGLYLIGCIDDDGYIRRDTHSLVDDLAFTQNIITNDIEVEEMIIVLQSLDPAGIAARSLQECLLLQLERNPHKTKEIHFAIDVVKTCMDEFSRKHYDKIARKLDISEEELKEVLHEITKLNPKPGSTSTQSAQNNIQEVIPDFVISNNDGELELSLTSRNMPDLKVSADYLEMLTRYNKQKDKSSKEASGFIKTKVESAQWFIEALFQRKQTLLIAMNAIMQQQTEYFLTGDETKLKPMILKDIAEKVGLDISTVSRVANSKYVTTPFGTMPLKFFFSESLSTDSGEEVSSREVKKILSDFIGAENKRTPLTDDALGKMLKEKGYNIARRTIAKYREQLDIPVARMRKEI